jgi:hypothetical protein
MEFGQLRFQPRAWIMLYLAAFIGLCAKTLSRQAADSRDFRDAEPNYPHSAKVRSATPSDLLLPAFLLCEKQGCCAFFGTIGA